ncbi:MAG TPA: alanine racemase [Gammaproteobacteria bacterium]|nr:alanine racemase [Gammaproteobacteria bacterium]
MSRPASILIHREAARRNLSALRALAPRSRVLAVVKADAYGHGMAAMAAALRAADALGVASLDEAAELRASGWCGAILLLEGVHRASDLGAAARLGCSLVVHRPGQIEALEAWSGPAFSVWLKADTGMHRLGFLPEEFRAAWQRLHGCAAVAGDPVLMTHLANAQARDQASVAAQVRCFDAVTEGLPGERSIANSAALLSAPVTHRDWVRPGLALYGVSPFEGVDAPPPGLVPVMHFASELISVRTIPAGGAIGYGGCFICPVSMNVGVVAAGYGDGYPTGDLTGTPIVVNGVRTRVLGRSSMDMLTVDLGPVPDPREGDPVEVWGGRITVAEVARHAGSLPWALLCAARLRVPRAELRPLEDEGPAVLRALTGSREA